MDKFACETEDSGGMVITLNSVFHQHVQFHGSGHKTLYSLIQNAKMTSATRNTKVIIKLYRILQMYKENLKSFYNTLENRPILRTAKLLFGILKGAYFTNSRVE
jgi:hypothetical protein